MTENKLRITVTGGILDTTGYANHTRGLVNALYKVADVKLNTQLCQGWERMVNDQELDMITKVHKENDVNVIITTPHMWKLFLGTGLNCVYCVWEGSKVPLSYIDEMLNPKINLIFVPSEHTYNAIINTLPEVLVKKEYTEEDNKWINLANKIKIIPHGVDFSLFHPKEKI
jgi:hypothetical protein